MSPVSIVADSLPVSVMKQVADFNQVVQSFYQWRSQKLLVVGPDPSAGGARVEAPAPSGVESGKGFPVPSRLGDLRERRKLPSGVRGEAPAENAIFCIF